MSFGRAALTLLMRCRCTRVMPVVSASYATSPASATTMASSCVPSSLVQRHACQSAGFFNGFPVEAAGLFIDMPLATRVGELAGLEAKWL